MNITFCNTFHSSAALLHHVFIASRPLSRITAMMLCCILRHPVSLLFYFQHIVVRYTSFNCVNYSLVFVDKLLSRNIFWYFQTLRESQKNGRKPVSCIVPMYRGWSEELNERVFHFQDKITHDDHQAKRNRFYLTLS